MRKARTCGGAATAACPAARTMAQGATCQKEERALEMSKAAQQPLSPNNGLKKNKRATFTVFTLHCSPLLTSEQLGTGSSCWVGEQLL